MDVVDEDDAGAKLEDFIHHRLERSNPLSICLPTAQNARERLLRFAGTRDNLRRGRALHPRIREKVSYTMSEEN